MKKVFVALLIILFFLLILGAFLFKLFKPSTVATSTPPVQFPAATTATASQNPAQFVKSFYEWYLLNFSRDPLFPHPENRAEVLRPWLTNDFLATWDETLSEIEVNPVLLTAEDPSSWGGAVSAKVISQSSQSSQVYATIGSGASLHAYNVNLVKSSDGTWKIASVASTI